jgi:DNA polymerase elongation subunit (family B)
LRRHDCPSFLKNFQKRLLEILFDAECVENLKKDQFKKAQDYVVEIYEEIMNGKIDPEKLVISKVLRKPVDEYQSMFPHVVAAIQMMQKGKKLKPGEIIDFLYVNAAHKNPFRRVVPAAILNNSHCYYDKEKYSEMVLDVAETVLSLFGFNGEQNCFRPKSKNYLEELYYEREDRKFDLN